MQNLFCCASVILLASASQLPVSAIPYPLIAELERHDEPDESYSYNYLVSLRRTLVPADAREASIKLISPDGQQFVESTFTGWVQVTSNANLPDQIDAAFAGDWVIEETFADVAIERYQFTLPSVVNSSRFTSPPEITSPVDGSIVGPDFDLLWRVPDDAGDGFG